MKLNTLKISNIGPYKGEHIIDFNQLNNSLYLITGPTGAGKSYIFDAICYAIYNKTSGDNRQSSDMKSKYATSADTAYVELEFEYNGKTYKIYREPFQVKQSKKKKGGQYVDKDPAASAELTLPDGTILTKEKEVDSKLRDIIGLDYNQFKMTMMIAQGDFYSLINAKTSDRQEIFRKILHTDKLSDFTEQLKELTKNKQIDKEKMEEAIKGCRNRFQFENSDVMDKLRNVNELLSSVMPLIDDEINKDNEELKNETTHVNALQSASKTMHDAYRQATEDNTNLAQYQKELSDNQALKSQEEIFKDLSQKIDTSKKASKVKQAYDIYQKDDIDINNLETNINNEQNKLTVEQAKLENMSNYTDRIKNIEVALAKNNLTIDTLNKQSHALDDYNKLKQDRDNYLTKENTLKDELSKIEENITATQEAINALKPILDEPNKQVELEKVNNKIADIDKEINSFSNNEGVIDNYIKATNHHKDLINNYNKASEELDKKNHEYEAYDITYNKSLAGILAKDLKEDMPCPVCGAIHHIKLAVLTEEVSKEQLDKLKKEKDNLSQKQNEAKSKMDINGSTIEGLENQIKGFIKQEFDANNVLDIFNDIVSEMKKSKDPLLQEQTALQSDIDKQEQAEKNKAKLEETLVSLRDEKTHKDNEINTNKGDLDRISGQLEAKKDLEGLDKESIDKQAKDLKDTNNSLNNDKYALQKELTNQDKLVSNLKTSIEAYQKQLDSKKSSLSITKKTYEDSLNHNNFTDINEVINAIIDDLDLNKDETSLEKYKQELATSHSKLQDYINKGYDKLTHQDLEELEEKDQEASQAYDTENAHLTTLTSRCNANNTTYNELKGYETQYQVIEKEYNDLNVLSNVASGKVSKTKVNFEVYYQLQVFDEILKVASYKFNQMTDGRYELLQGKPKGGNGQMGLEIDVKDIYNGETRPVSGLSGGESFQASMSLALAFSEIIQVKAGGIELNSMFIDEGFGTLDNEMLENTKKTLLQIGQQTNRKIGIISHIAELENSIPSKIIVSKTDKGSSFKIVNE